VFAFGCEDTTFGDVNPVATGVSFGGQALTKATSAYNTDSKRVSADIWYLKEADIPAGSNTIVVTYDNGTVSPFGGCGYIYTLSGIDQTTPLGQTSVTEFASMITWTAALAGTTAGSIIVSGYTSGNPVFALDTWDGPLTQRGPTAVDTVFSVASGDGVSAGGSIDGSVTLTNGRPGAVAMAEFMAAAAVPTISDVTPSTVTPSSNPVITGTNFEAAQGTGAVTVSPTDDVDDVNAEAQTIGTWGGDTSITLTGVTFPTGTTHSDTLYLFVTNDSGETNASGYVLTAQLQATLPSITLYDIDGQTALPTPLTSVRWAWFDELPAGSGLLTPVGSGTGLTITNGALSLTVNNSYLASGEYGMLLLEEPTSGRRQAYRLQVV
jgi:hypothetical protein